MTTVDDRARTIFLAALDQPPDRLRAFLDEACGHDADVRARVDQLLLAHHELGSIHVGSAPVATVDLPPVTEAAGTVVGPYKLVEQIGEGGMGSVWMAQQTEPVKRLVAVKLIKAGMDSRQVLARFEAERQALALMDHPNIARVLDAGATPDGRPYFVMELVKGVPITKYCDDHKLTPRQRLELFIPVCQAVQHAHQKGIIHRDIKPSNVLVALYDGRPVPKVIDFGVAKAAGQPLTDKTLVTGFGAIVGTLEYMSPEQAETNQLDIDTRSDIYSLGVLLYELLAGSPPFSRKDLEKAGMLEMLRVIREEEPSKPSTKLSTAEGLPTLAANRGTEPVKLTKLVRGELDWIVMKALEKDRTRRYETANGFAADVQRHLADEPVLACPPTVGYRLRKFARRNKRALLTASVIGVALLLAVGSLGWALRDREAGRVRTTVEVNQFLDRAESLYTDNKLPEAVGEVQKARGVLEAGRGDEALGRRVEQWLTDLDTAAKLEEIRLESFDWDDRDRGYTDYARVFRDYGIDVEALPAEEAAARVADSQIKVDLALALSGWAFQLQSDPRVRDPARWQRLLTIARAGDPDPWLLRLQAAAEAKDVQTLRELTNGVDVGRLRTRTLAFLGYSLSKAGDAEAAVAFLRRVQRQHPRDLSINSTLALCLGELKPPRLNEVIEFRRLALAVRPQSAGAHSALGDALRRNNRLDEAILEHHEAVRLNPGNANTHNGLGLTLNDQKKLDEAIAEYRTAISIDPQHSWAHYNLGNALRDQKKLDEAIAEYHKALAIDPNYVWTHINLGNRHHDRRNLDAAIACFKKAIEIDPKCDGAHYNLGNALHEQKKLDEAIAEYRTAISIDPQHSWAHYNLGNALRDQKKLDEAIAEYRTAISIIDPPHVLASGLALRDQKKLDEAIAWCKKAIDIDPKIAKVHNSLGIALYEQKKLDEAVAEYRTAIEIDANYAGPHYGLGVALHDQKKLNEAAAEYRTAIDIDPIFADAHYGLGNAFLEQKQFGEAAAEYRHVIRLKPDRADAYNGLGNALMKQNKLSEAVAEYRKAIDIDPKFFGAHFNLGSALHVQKKIDEAVAEFRTAIAIDAKHAAAHHGLGNVLKDQDKLDEAIDCCMKALAIDPKHAEAHNVIGIALKRQNKLDAAVAEYRRAIEIDPKTLYVHYNLGIALQGLNRLDEAIAAYRKAIEIDPKLASAHYNLGNTLAAQNKLEDAIVAYREAIRIRPDHSFAHNQLGIALHGQKKLPEAIVEYLTAIRIDPKNAAAHYNLGRALSDQKKPDEAIAEYRKAIELDPNLANAHNGLGALLCDSKRDYEGASACFKKVIEIEPKNAAAHYNLGNALRGQTKLPEAIACYRKAIELAPSFAAAHVALGDVLREQEKLDEAITAYFGAIPVKPAYAAAHHGVGLARSAQGRWVEAKTAYRESIRNRADFYEARRNLALLLTTCPDPNLRDPREAVEHAKKAVELQPQDSLPWQVLGWARYRAGAWQASIEALESSCKLQPGGTGGHSQWIVLALAHARLAAQPGLPEKARESHKSEARRWYEQADKSIDSKWRVRPDYREGDLGQAIWDFREEARALMPAKVDKQ